MTKRNFNSVFLDVGGTLVDFDPQYHVPVYRYLTEKGYEVTEKAIVRAINKQFGEVDRPNYAKGLLKPNYDRLLREIGVSSPEHNNLIRELEQLNLLTNRYRLYPDVIPFLTEVKNLGYKVVLITNASPSIYTVISNLGLQDYVDGIIASCDLGIMKPSPHIFHRAVEVAGSWGVHIGDVYEVDYIGAERAGLKGILLDRYGYYDDIMNINKIKDLTEALDILRVEDIEG